jgi:hypothetical protein
MLINIRLDSHFKKKKKKKDLIRGPFNMKMTINPLKKENINW